MALVHGEIGAEDTLVRVHSQNLWTDVFHGDGMKGHHTLDAAFQAITAAGKGVVLYMEPPNAGSVLVQRLQGGAAAVASSIDPEVGRSLLSWNCRTADWVIGPNCPSTGPVA